MAHLTINVPEALVDDLRRELLRAHGACGDALRRGVEAYLDSHGGLAGHDGLDWRDGLDDVEGALVELRDLHDALAQLAAAAPVALTAHPEVLADALRALLAARPDDESLRWLVRIVEWGSR